MGQEMPQGDAPTTRFTAPIQQYVDTVILPDIARGEPIFLKGVVGQGCVFGIRGDDGNWVVYLQENVNVTYTRFPHNQDVLYVNRPLRVRQIWPPTADAPLVNPNPKGLP